MSYIDNMRKGRDALAVTKIEFANFVSGVSSDNLIFVFEGRDDKIAYAHWLRQIDQSIKYEALVKNNKNEVLKLYDALIGDLTGILKRTKFFVDRDFDDLKGRDGSEFIFMTDCYAIENYCVTSEVLDSILQEEFHCNGLTEARQQILCIFKKSYEDFLLKTKPINFRIFIARRLGIVQDDKLPNRLNQLAIVNLHGVNLINENLEFIVPLTREPNENEICELENEFLKLEPINRYRGKFALMFFCRWLELLRSERCTETSDIFSKYGHTDLKVRGDFSFEKLILRTIAPTGLSDFLKVRVPVSDEAVVA